MSICTAASSLRLIIDLDWHGAQTTRRELRKRPHKRSPTPCWASRRQARRRCACQRMPPCRTCTRTHTTHTSAHAHAHTHTHTHTRTHTATHWAVSVMHFSRPRSTGRGLLCSVDLTPFCAGHFWPSDQRRPAKGRSSKCSASRIRRHSPRHHQHHRIVCAWWPDEGSAL